MLFYIVDDDEATRAMLAEIIEDEDLGVVVGEASDGSLVDEQLFALQKVQILLIDLLMPIKAGIETIQDLKPIFNGKIVMISQVESKELIAQAYSYGAEYYITKPINKIEVISVIKKVIERIYLERSLHHIYQLAGNVLPDHPSMKKGDTQHDFTYHAQHLLSELGIIGENGYQDLLDILDYLFEYEKEKSFKDGLPQLKVIFKEVVQRKHGTSFQLKELNREIKASEQRTRRAIYQSLNHLASLGLNDFTNPTFEHYAPKFFDFAIVQERMKELKKGKSIPNSHVRINTKKFTQVLYFETKRLVAGE